MIGDNGMSDIDEEGVEATDYATYEAYKGFIEIGMDHDEAIALLNIDEAKLDSLLEDNEPSDFEDE